MTIFRSPELDDQFARNGFVVVPLMDSGTAARLRECCRQHLPAQLPACENVTYIYTDEPELAWIEDVTEPIFTGVLRPLLDRVRQLHSSVIVKPAGERAVPPHVHPIFTLEQRQSTVFCWCALEDMTDENGVMEVLPGSHKLFPIMPMYNREPYFLPAWDEVCQRMVPIYMKAGEALLFDESLIHASKANRSSEDRLALATHFIASDLEPIALFPDEPGQFRVFRTGVEFGYQYHIRPDLIDPPEHWPFLGYVDDVHRLIGADEFVQRLESQERIDGAFPIVAKRETRKARPNSPGTLRDRAKRAVDRLFQNV